MCNIQQNKQGLIVKYTEMHFNFAGEIIHTANRGKGSEIMTYKTGSNTSRTGTRVALVALALVAFSLAVLISPLGVSAEATDIRDGDLIYNITSEPASGANGTVVLVGIESAPATVTIPGTVVHGGKTYNVVSIGAEAFGWHTDLKSVAIPDSVRSMGNEAFNNCTSLESIHIHSGLTEIGANAFLGCTSPKFYVNVDNGNANYSSSDGMLLDKTGSRLIQARNATTIAVPDGVKTIEDFAFTACDSVAKVSLPPTLEKIGAGAFFECHNLKSIDFTKAPKLKSISMNAFSGCHELGTADFSKCTELKFIGQNAFEGCHSLGDIKLPASVENIGTRTFASCCSTDFFITVAAGNTHYSSEAGTLYDSDKETLIKARNTKTVAIPASVKTISDGAFRGCNKLEKIVISSEIVTIGESAFNGCRNVAFSFEVSPSNPNYMSDNGMLYSKDGSILIQGRNVKSFVASPNLVKIDAGAFLRCHELLTVDLSRAVGLQEIGTAAFQMCTEIETVAMSPGVKSISNNAFAECDMLSQIDLQTATKLKSIEFNAFESCYSLGTVVINAEVSKIGDNAFSGCMGDSFRFDVDVRNSNYSSWDGMLLDKNRTVLIKARNTQTLSVPSSVVRIHDDAFGGFDLIKKVTLQPGVKTVGANAFFGCTSIDALIFTGDSLPGELGLGSFTMGTEDSKAAVTVYSSFDASSIADKGLSNANTNFTFKPLSGLFKVNIDVGRGGYAVPDGVQYAKQGESIKMSFVANPSHRITDIIVDGNSVGPLDSYILSDISSNRSVHVEMDTPSGDLRIFAVALTAVLIVCVLALVLRWYFKHNIRE